MRYGQASMPGTGTKATKGRMTNALAMLINVNDVNGVNELLADLEADGDVDLDDFSVFQEAFTGS